MGIRVSNSREKIQGLQRGLSLNDRSFDEVVFDSVSFENCSFIHTAFNRCAGRHVSLNGCQVYDPQFSNCDSWDHVRLVNTNVIKVQRQIDVTVLSHVEASTFQDVSIYGKRSQPVTSLSMMESTIVGKLAHVTIFENQAQDQLLGCDFSRCSMHDVRLMGIPVDRCQLPDSISPIIIEDWPDVANDVLVKALSIFNDPGYTPLEKTAASAIIADIQLDAGAFHSARGTHRTKVEDLGLPPERGARLVSELRDTSIPRPVLDAIQVIYQPWITF